MTRNSICPVFSLVFLSGIGILIQTATCHSIAGNQITYRFTEPTLPKAPPLPVYYQNDPNGQQDLESITTEERISGFGYPVELHEVTTQDGYILTMHRIPHGRNAEPLSARNKPVLFQHGGLGDSFSWFFNHPDRIIPFQLADAGYDIWIANVRGTIYSRRHTHLTDCDKQFFDFSIDDIAQYDIPAEIDYILNKTGEPKLMIVAISLGPAEVHMTLSLLPEYNEKISLITSLAPTVYDTKAFPMAKILNLLGDQSTLFKNLLDFISGGSGEFPPLWLVKFLRTSGRMALEACKFPIVGTLCKTLSLAIYGAPTHPEKLKVMPLGISHALAPVSTRMGDQFSQWLRRETFQRYDFGSTENLRVYGTPKPPLHYLKDTTAPVAVYYAENDFLVVPADVARTVSELPNVVLFHRINSKSWNHVDFLTGHDVNELFTDQLIELFQKY